MLRELDHICRQRDFLGARARKRVNQLNSRRRVGVKNDEIFTREVFADLVLGGFKIGLHNTTPGATRNLTA